MAQCILDGVKMPLVDQVKEPGALPHSPLFLEQQAVAQVSYFS